MSRSDMSTGVVDAGAVSAETAAAQHTSGGAEASGHTITVNGETLTLPMGSSLVDLVARMTGRALATDGAPEDGGRLGVAVAVDSTVVPRSLWRTVEPSPGQEIEVITAMQGG